jgi:hypothetical protein
MRKISFFVICIFLASCQEEEVSVETPVADSIILKSQDNLIVSEKQNAMADSAVAKKTQKIIEKIGFLTREVYNYKLEREKMLEEIKTTTSKVVYKIDTVYIETKKNFWGKTKTSTSVKSDSLVSESVEEETSKSLKVDSMLVQKIDTIKNN